MNVLIPPTAAHPGRVWNGDHLFPGQVPTLSLFISFCSHGLFFLVQLQLVYIKILAQPRALGCDVSGAVSEGFTAGFSLPHGLLPEVMFLPYIIFLRRRELCLVSLEEEEVPCLAAANNHALDGHSAFLGPRSSSKFSEHSPPASARSLRKFTRKRAGTPRYIINKSLGSCWTNKNEVRIS